MTRAKPGEFARNYAAWSSLLCSACAMRSKYNLGRLRASEDNLLCQEEPVRVDPQATRHFTRTVAAEIKLYSGWKT